MGKMNVKDGTPMGNEHLCSRCTWNQCMTGYRESDRLVICTNTNPNMVIPFTVMECTGFSDKHRPDWEQMEKLAIHVGSARVSRRTAGFSSAVEARPLAVPEVADDEDEENEAALAS